MKAYLVSMPSVLPADEYYDVVNAITERTSHHYYDTDAPEPETTLAKDVPSVFITHGEAYCTTLPHNITTPTILFLDFYPDRLSSGCLSNSFDAGDRQTKTIYTLTSSLSQGISDCAKNGDSCWSQIPIRTGCAKQSTASTTSYCTHLPRNTLSRYPNYYQHPRCYLFHCCPPLHKVEITTTIKEARTINCPTSCWCRFSLWECNYSRTPWI